MAPTLKILASVLRPLNTLTKYLRNRPNRFLPQHLLPTELWATIFDELSEESDLLRAATVCATFNALCIHIIVRRRMPGADNPEEIVFLSPWLELWSPMLAVIHLSFRPLQTGRLTCYFAPVNIRRNLRLLEDCVARCPVLDTLDIFFHEDLLRLHCARPAPRFSREELTSVLCSTISTMAGRIAGPVIIFTADTFAADICSCWPADIAEWGLHMAKFEHSTAHKLESRARHILRLKEKAIPESPFDRLTHIRMHTGEMREVHAPSVLFSVHLWSSPSNSLSKPFTLLLFNNRLITRLILCQFRRDRGYLPPEYLNLAPFIDPTALGIFLHQHPTIEDLEYCGRSDEPLPRPVVDPPLVHPGLITLDIGVNGKASTGRLIPALIHSPNLHTFRFSIMSDLLSPANLSGFASDLRNISLRNNDIHLQFYMYSGTFPASELFDVAGTLQCIRWVDVHGGVADCLSILPWLALLPAALAVHFTVNFDHYPHPRLPDEIAANELAEFTVSAGTALGPGRELTVERFMSSFL
ncbi:hypothetical protein C8R47DRAFT_1243589 [Mycena vitilis]|nr:hypothetical protein C8R47DRAFT_1243589 [Mycena vitilis]